MQLIPESEPALAVKDMSSVEDITTEKAGNGDINQIKKINNGNKENISDVNVIKNIDDAPKEITNVEDNAKLDAKLEDKDDEITSETVNKEDDCELSNPNETNAQKEESRSTSNNEDTHNSNKELDNVPAVTEEKENDSVETENADANKNVSETDNITLKTANITNKIEDDYKTAAENIPKETSDNSKESSEIENNPSENSNNPTEIERMAVETDSNDVEAASASEEADSNTVETSSKCGDIGTNAVEKGNTALETTTKADETASKVEETDSKAKETGDLSVNTDSKPVERIVEKVAESDSNPREEMETDDSPVETDITLKEGQEKTAETAQDDIMEDEEDIISIKDDVLEQARESANSSSDTVVLENVADKDKTSIENEPSNAKDDVEVIEDQTETEASQTDKCDKISDTNRDMGKNISNNQCEKANCDSNDVILSNDKDAPIELKDDMDVEEVVKETSNKKQPEPEKATAPVNITVDKNSICKLSNTLDILSDDDEPPAEEPPKADDSNQKQCISIEDDDDVMLVDEDTSATEPTKLAESEKVEASPAVNTVTETVDVTDSAETGEKAIEEQDDLYSKNEKKEDTKPVEELKDDVTSINISDKQEEPEVKKPDLKPLLPEDFLKSAKKNVSEMTREDLEEFCILKIVESIVDRSNLSEIKNKLKTMAQNIDGYRKNVTMLTKQNKDLQVVLKAIQEEQKKMSPDIPITPLKITRSVGMQVYMEKPGVRRKGVAQLNNSANANNSPNNKQNVRTPPAMSPRPQKMPGNQTIPVPRLVPANTPVLKGPNSVTSPANPINANKTTNPVPNGVRLASPQKLPEKRPHNKVSSSSVTVDLTDDEPPTKMNNNRTSPAPPVRLVSPQSLLATPKQQFTPVNNSRKVYIPISGPQNQNLRPGQTIMLKTVPAPGLRPRGVPPQAPRLTTGGAVRVGRNPGRHPAPLPDAAQQYQPPNWKALPPAPELKLSKVENGIVISWKIEGCLADSYEEIASYQLYAYQETSSPPNTSLWKKIGDVKALPLPMACTLTQFMAGFKYYFAVRAVDIRSRIGPFSLPGSILLLNKM